MMNGTGRNSNFPIPYGRLVSLHSLPSVQAPAPCFPIVGAGPRIMSGYRSVVQSNLQPLPCTLFQSAPGVISEVKQHESTPIRQRYGKIRMLPVVSRSPLMNTPPKPLKRKMVPIPVDERPPLPAPPHPLYERISAGMKCTSYTHYQVKLHRRCCPTPIYYCERQNTLKVRKTFHMSQEDAEVAGINQSRVLKDTIRPTNLHGTCFRSIWFMEEHSKGTRKELEELAKKKKTTNVINNVVGNSGGTVIRH